MCRAMGEFSISNPHAQAFEDIIMGQFAKGEDHLQFWHGIDFVDEEFSTIIGFSGRWFVLWGHAAHRIGDAKIR